MSEEISLSLATVDEIAAELKRRSGNGYSFALFVQKLGGYPKIDQHWYFGSDAGPPGIASRFLDGVQLAPSDCDQSNCKRTELISNLSWLSNVVKREMFVMEHGLH